MEKSQGTMIEAGPQGTSVDGGWLARKKIPPAAEISKLLALLGVAGLVMLGASRVITSREWKTQHRREMAVHVGI
jgi:hypothetical protein